MGRTLLQEKALDPGFAGEILVALPSQLRCPKTVPIEIHIQVGWCPQEAG